MSDQPPESSSPSPDPSDWLTRARYLVYGTAASFVEMLQDPEKRTENISKLGMDIDLLAEELVAKGQLTEQEAIQYVEQAQAQAQVTEDSDPAADPIPETESAQATEDPDPAETSSPMAETARISPEDVSNLMGLTREIERLRMDMERFRTDAEPDDATH